MTKLIDNKALTTTKTLTLGLLLATSTLTACVTGDSSSSDNNNSTVAETPTQDYTTTASGLKYKKLVAASGNSPLASDSVTVHYEGKLTNGQVFDSSYARGKPATFPLNRVIQGWTEGLQLMQEGEIFEFYIPSELAYGESGNRGIPPNSPLIFTVELIKVNN